MAEPPAGPAVVLVIPAVPEHVRTARLVALAVARRTGLGVEVADEVRLAVGEACSRAVRRAAGSPLLDHRVEVRLDDAPDRLAVEVLHRHDGNPDPAAAGVPAPDDDEVSLRLLHGLGPDVEVTDDTVRLVWTAAAVD